MATIRDVAKLSGVSIATVSNVLNARDDKVSSETRERVLAAVRRLRYRPTALEKDQMAIQARNLGILVADMTAPPLANAYFREVLDGVLEAAMFRGWSTTVFVERMWGDIGLAIRRSYDGRCDGLICAAPSEGSETVKTLVERGVPIVFTGSTSWIPGVSSVDVDNFAIGCAAADHLVDLGHTTFMYVGYSLDVVSSAERGKAFRARLEERGINPIHIERVNFGHFDPELPSMLIERLRRGKLPTGVFCWNDEAAELAALSLQGEGVRVPKDISVIGVDGVDHGEKIRLTTFRQPLHAIGKRAVNMLIDRLADESLPAEIVRYPAQLVQGTTSGPAPVHHLDAKAFSRSLP